jgi:excinuclease ABC subunit A
VDRVEAVGTQAGDDGFAATDWSQRDFVKINGSGKSTTSFPFLHAMTSSEWVVTLRFFVPKHTVRPKILERQLGLTPFHESHTPILCDQPRLKVEDLGPFQEIIIVCHAVSDLQTEGFDAFLKKAAAAYLNTAKPRKLIKATDLI